jgi:hypothetical protein
VHVAVRDLAANRVRKKAPAGRLPRGRGSISSCKHVDTFLGPRGRQQVVFGLFPHPAKEQIIFGHGERLAGAVSFCGDLREGTEKKRTSSGSRPNCEIASLPFTTSSNDDKFPPQRVTMGFRTPRNFMPVMWALAVLFVCAPLFAQTDTGRILGSVSDRCCRCRQRYIRCDPHAGRWWSGSIFHLPA